MPINFEAILTELFNKGIVIAALVARRNGEIVYCSSNWSAEASDVAQCINKWLSHSQLTTLQGIKYSILMNTDEYFSGVNFKERTFLLGAASLDENDRYYVLGYAPAGVDGKSAYVDVVRAANQMRENTGTYLDDSVKLGKYDSDDVAGGAPAGIQDSALKQEIDGFVQWIKDPNGLSGYIQYYLDQNDPGVLQKLSKAYNDFRQVFGF